MLFCLGSYLELRSVCAWNQEKGEFHVKYSENSHKSNRVLPYCPGCVLDLLGFLPIYEKLDSDWFAT